MRPVYETAEDQENEADVVSAVEDCWGTTFVKFPSCIHIEGALFRGRLPVWAVIEIKCRNNNREKYRTLSISATKIKAGDWWSRFFRVPFYLIIRWNDGIYWWELPQGYVPEVRQGGRTDRGDPMDIEDMAHIPVDQFLPLNEAKT